MINLLFTGNTYAFDGILTTSLSILKYSNEPFIVYILTADLQNIKSSYTPLTEKERLFLEKIYKRKNEKSKVNLYDFTKQYFDILSISKNANTKYTPYASLRLLLEYIPNLPNKILYLDTDVLLLNDIKTLYETDISNYEIAGGLDYYGKFFINKKYINSGVLLINTHLISKTNLFKKAVKTYNERKMLLPDQTAINRHATKKLILKRKFNEQKKIKPETVIRHYTKTIKWLPVFHTKNIKPWQTEIFLNTFKKDNQNDIITNYKKLKREYQNGK